MNKILFAAASLVGAITILWIGNGFVVSGNFLALTVTVLIGVVYGIGVFELMLFRRTTISLSQALASIPEGLAQLDGWLAKIPTALQSAVRMRIEGERAGLPGPALTPYLVGLLVMLGMLGTFMGMVVTLQGAVTALEGTTELEAIRSGLAAPIKGLGLAFGTSVAGVAASAVLGLISTLSRRDRLQAAQLLDKKVASDLRNFSLTHNRQETYRALQLQAQALPNLVDKLQAMALQMERMGTQLNDRLLSNQESFHRSAKEVYVELAQSVENSLKTSLAESGRLAGESIKPVVAEAMATIVQEAQSTQQTLLGATQQQLGDFAERFNQAASLVADKWQDALSSHEHTNEQLIHSLERTLSSWSEETRRSQDELNEAAKTHFESFVQGFNSTTSEVAATWRTALSQHEQSQEHLLRGIGQSLSGFNESFQQNSSSLLTSFSQTALALEAERTSQDQQRLENWTAGLQTMAHQLSTQWQQTGEQTALQQQKISAVLEATAKQITEHTHASASTLLQEMSHLLGSSEELVRTRMAVEESWLKQHGERMDQLARNLAAELGTLRDAEAARGQAAVDQLATLQAALADHLAALGTALEAPMSRLIETASEAPRAAADVIAQLRQEISNATARDNQLLEERSRIMEGLDKLLVSLNQSSSEQRGAIDQLVTSSAQTLKEIGGQFATHVGEEAVKLSAIAAQVSGSAVEVSSLGETFGFAVQRFAESNDRLIENLSDIEAALDKSTARSDEQLAYYVAQAREIIDLSMLSQKEIFEELRQLKTEPHIIRTGAA